MEIKELINKLGLERVLRSRRLRKRLMDELYIDPKQILMYKAFIDNSFSNENEFNQKDIEDTCDISIEIEYFTPKSTEYFSIISNRKIHHITKLSILDYLLFFHAKINKKEYYKINNYFSKNKNIMVKFQALLNLSLLHNNNYNKVISILKNQIYPTLYYRLVNSLLLNKELIKCINFDEIKLIISDNTNLSKEIRFDITTRLKSSCVT